MIHISPEIREECGSEQVPLGAQQYMDNPTMRGCMLALSLRTGVTQIMPDLNEFIFTE
jgi:hypothetical protein